MINRGETCGIFYKRYSGESLITSIRIAVRHVTLGRFMTVHNETGHEEARKSLFWNTGVPRRGDDNNDVRGKGIVL